MQTMDNWSIDIVVRVVMAEHVDMPSVVFAYSFWAPIVIKLWQLGLPANWLPSAARVPHWII